MTRIFTDGAEFGDNYFFSSGGSISSSSPRTGSYCYRVWESSGYKNILSVSEVYLRVAIWLSAFSSSFVLAAFRKGTTTLGSIKMNATSHVLEFYVGGTLVASGTIPTISSGWFLLEWHYKLDNSGVSQIKYEGVLDIDYSGDTTPDSNTNFDNIYFASTNGIGMAIDDLALNDTGNSDGKGDNSWCGDGRIEILMPNGNGNVNEWTGSDSNSTDNYALVDEVPPSSTDYVEDSTPGNQDAYTITDFTGTNKQILRVWAEARAMDTVPEGAQMKIGLRTNSTDYLSAAKTLLTSYSVVKGDEYKLNPNDSAAWEDADLDALELVLETV
jgi:hypothetical protein